MWFTAEYDGVCDDCGGRICAGSPIVRSGGGYRHAVCPNEDKEVE